MKLNQTQLDSYLEDGYLLLENAIDDAMLACLRQTIAGFVERARKLGASYAMFDIDPGARARPSRLRRLKAPHRHHALLASEAIVEPVSQLLGGTVRFDHSRLNFKYPGTDSIYDSQAVCSDTE